MGTAAPRLSFYCRCESSWDQGFSECGNTHDVTLGDPCYRKGEQTGRTKAGRSCGGKTVRRDNLACSDQESSRKGFRMSRMEGKWVWVTSKSPWISGVRRSNMIGLES